MKPLLLKVGSNEGASFDIRHDSVPYFNNPWHYHPEFELTLVLKSSGVRFIGDSIEAFQEKDLILVGANLPHYWRNHTQFYSPRSTERAEAIIMRFSGDIWGKEFLKTPEMSAVSKLLQQARLGIKFPPEIADHVKPILIELLSGTGVRQPIGWLQIFERLASASNYQLLATKSFGVLKGDMDSNRIDRVLMYIHEHLSDSIRLTDVAAFSNMNTAAFCRFFKQRTNKTFVEVVNEVRIQAACRLLAASDQDISEIAYDCGFQDLSYFSQVFKTKMGVSPSGFRRKNLLAGI